MGRFKTGLLCGVTSVSLFILGVGWGIRGEPVAEIRASRFILVDEEGGIAGIWRTDISGWSDLAMFGEDGLAKLILRVRHDPRREDDEV